MNWNQNSWNQEKKKKGKDSFWYGFIPAITLPMIFNIIIFKSKYTTAQPVFIAMYKFSKTGLMGKDMLASILPMFVLLSVFYHFKKDRASQGLFVGIAPYLIITFWLF